MKKAFLTAVLSIMTGMVLAVPAYPDLVVFQQPNREITVSIFLKGDERIHWAETEDGYSLLHSDDGSLVYAMRDERGDMVTSHYLATEIADRSKEVNEFLGKTPKHLHYSQEQVDVMLKIWKDVEEAKTGPKTMSNVLGNKKFLVILFQFSNKSFTYGKQAFRMMFNQVNYTTNGATGSVHDYYYDVSGGLFSLNVDVVGPYTGVYELAHYGNSDNGYQDFAHEAVDSAVQDVDFSLYDNDNDGHIDGLHIIFAGYGEEAGASEDCIWSHKWNIFNPPTYNNTIIDVYSCSPELSGYYGTNMTKIGVICHELGHVFGAPDFYDTDYSGSGGEYPGLGQWDIMSSGSWNRGGISPAHHNPYTKIYIYHWATCDTLNDTTGTIVMNSVANSNSDFYRVNTNTTGDFFLLENRQKVKWDKGIPGHGMLVYHIHPNAHGSNVSNYRHPQQIYILAQTNIHDTFPNSSPSSYGNLNNGTTPYPGEYNNRDSLTDNSVPWFRPWSKNANNVPITNISEYNGLIYFTINYSQPNPLNARAEGVSNNSIELKWERYASRSTMILMNANGSQFGTPQGTLNVGDTVDGGGIVVYIGNGDNTVIDSLLRGHTYHFMFLSVKNNNYSDGIIREGTTFDCDGDNWTVYDFENTENGILPNCWSGEWSVDSMYNQRVITSPHYGVESQKSWQSVTAEPVVLNTPSNAVLHFRYKFDGNASESTLFKVEYKPTASDGWETIYSNGWRFGMAEWEEVYIPLNSIGNYSLIRFSAFCDGSDYAAIDAVELKYGVLMHSSCDANGMISPMGYTILENTNEITYSIAPLSGYELGTITLDNVVVDASQYTINDNDYVSYTITNINNHHNVYVTFAKKVGIASTGKSDIQIYPNPTTGMIRIENARGDISIYDITGRLLYKAENCHDSVSFDLSSLPKGVYIMHCDSCVKKIIKK
mgnify:CR=1 FL=1